MNRVCPITVPCLPDLPLGNFSSEAPDPFVFTRFHWPVFDPRNPIGGGRPPVPPVYFAGDCAGICTSTVSQADADLCAQRQGYICEHTPPGGHPPTFFSNAQQVCTIACDDTSTFFWVVPNGVFVGMTQAEADQRAFNYACNQVALHFFCLNPIPNEATVGTPYSATIFVEEGAPRQPVSFVLVAGTPPPGLTLHPEGPLSTVLSGTPTMGGTFNFTIQATDAQGIFVQKNYTITVTGQTCTDFWTSMAAQMVPSCFPPPAGVCGATYAPNVAHLSATSAGINTTALFPSAVQGTSIVPTQSELHCSITITFNSVANPAQVFYGLTVQNPVTFVSYLAVGLFNAVLGSTTYNFTIPAGVNVLVQLVVYIKDLVPIASYDAFVILGNSP